MTGNISYLSNYELYDGGYVSFGQGGGKITSKGTKDAASQDVKKDVSSLRYIALLNCGNSNPTATSTNPPTDHIETLTVESAIPTVSSPILTACLDDSLEPSSDTRLISKRVTSQDNTPSLDNILTLSNRFEDILGVTTNTCDTNGVEADLGNMENNISASPTPTFRIYKDHPKSHITGPVDTPVQTRNKSKEMEEQRVRHIGTKWVLKNKKDEKGIVIRNKARLVAQGHTHEEGIDYEEVFALVARIKAIRLFLAYASFIGFTVYQMDVKSAFLYGTIDEEVYVMQPPGFQDLEFPARVYKVEKAMHQVTPKECHLPAIKRIFRYLKGHPKLGLWNPKESPVDLVAYSDSDYGGATQDHKSTTGGCQILCRRLISWQCKKQTIVATSIIEAEYVAAASDCGQVLWIQNQLLDYGINKPWEALSKGITSFILLLLSFCDYHNMIAILEKYEHNVDFHQIVDFVKASHIRYALTINPTVYVSHIRQFWSTARIKTIDEGTKILTTVDGFDEFSSNIATVVVCLATNRVYNFSKMIFDGMVRNVNNKVSKFLMYPRVNSPSFSGRTVPLFDSMLVPQGEGSGTPTEPHHTPSPEAQQSPQHDLSSSIHLPVTTETIPTDFPTVSGLEAEQDKENIIKTSTLPHDSTPRVTSLAADEGSMQHKLQELTDLCTRLPRKQTEMATKIAAQDLEIFSLKARIKFLKDKDEGGAKPSREDATIKGRSLESGEEAAVEKSTERGSNETEELVNVLTSLDAANILTSGVQVVSVPPAAEVATVSIPTGSGMVPTASPIFTTASVVTPYSRRKGKEKMVESNTPKKKKLQEQIDVYMAKEMEEQLAREDQRMNEHITRDVEITRIHVEEELHMLIDGLDRNNETIAKYLQEYEQFATNFSIGEKIDMINEQVKYQDHYAKVLKYQSQQRKPLSKKQQREFYMSVLKSHSGWKTKHFKGMTLEEIREKFIPVWKQIEDFIPMASKEEAERVKRKGVRLEQESAKKVKTSKEVSKEDLKEMMQLVPVEEVYVEALQVKHLIIDWEIHTEDNKEYWKIIMLGGHTAVYQFFVDILKHFDKEDLT
nr:copia protein [Tanacetum cinerariifolium]